LVHQRAQKDMCNEVVNNHDHSIGANYVMDVGQHLSIKADTLCVEIANKADFTYVNGPTTVNQKSYSESTEGVVVKTTTGDVTLSVTVILSTTHQGVQSLTEIGAVGHFLNGNFGSVQIGDFKKTIFGNVG